MADDVIKIKFGVKGGASISGESGQLIKTQLEAISNKINLKIKIDKPYFTNQLKSLKSEIEKTLGNLPINIRTNTSGSNGSSGGKSTNDSSDFTKLKTKLKEIETLNRKMANTDPFGKTKTIEEYKKQLNQLNDEYKELTETSIISKKQNEQLDTQSANIDLNIKKLKALKAAQNQDKLLNSLPVKYGKVKDQALGVLDSNKELISSNKEAAKAVKELNDELNKPLSDNYEDAQKQIDNIKKLSLETEGALKQISIKNNTIANKMLDTLKNKIIQTFSYAIIAIVTRAFKQIYDNVIKIDSALTQLKIVTKESQDALEEYADSVSKSAKKIGVSVTDLIESTTTFARLGYSLEDSALFSELTAMYSKVGNTSVSDATTNLTAIIKAYNISSSDLESVIDQLVYVGNNYAISSSEIGEAMNNAASSLAANGNSLEESIGILTAANVTLQNVSKSSTAVRTIAARIAASEADLEDLGETTDDVVATATLDKKMRAFGVSIMDANGNLRSTYDILSDLSKVWGNLTSTQQSAIAGMLAGTRQQNAFYSIMQNWSDAESIVNSTSQSIGTLKSGYNDWLDSIEGKMGQLTASWEEFSERVLDSDLIKTIVDILKSVVDLLNSIASIGDGFLITIPILIVSLTALWAILVKIKSTTVFLTMWTQLKSILMIIPTILLYAKAWVLKIYEQITAHKGLTLALWEQKGATDAVTAAEEAAAAVNPIAWIVLAIAAIVALLKYLGNLADKTQALSDEAEKYKEIAENTKEEAEETKENTEELVDLVNQYRELTKDINNASDYSAETRQKVLEIQQKITDLVGEEAENYDLLNGNIEDNIKNNMQLLSTEASKAYQKAIDAYYAAANSSSHAYETSYKDVGGFNFWGLFGLTDPETFYQIVYQAGADAEKYADEVYNIIAGMDDRISISWDATLGDAFYGVNLNVNSAQEAVEVLDELLEKMRKAGYRDGDIYNQFNELREKYYSYISTQNAALVDATSAAVTSYGFKKYSEGLGIENLSEYEEYRNALIDEISNDSDLQNIISDETTRVNTVTTQVDNWLSTYFSNWYNKYTDSKKQAVIVEEEFLDILKDIVDEFDMLSDALSEIDKNGILSYDTLSKLFEKYEGLEKYFQLTGQGYKIADDYKNMSTMEILEDYTQSYLQPYVDALASTTEGTTEWNTAQENLNKAIAVMATLLRTQAIEDATEALEKQKDALDDQKDRYKDLIQIRKDLLETYQDEIDKQKELAEKTKKVADIQTKLALAKLDKSASGQARVRELEEELEDAKAELEEYTLDIAIEDLENHLDNSQDEYESFIEDQVEELEDAIDNISKNITVEVKLPSATTNDDGEGDTSTEDSDTKTYTNDFEGAKQYILDHGMMQGDKARWGQDLTFRNIWNNLTDEEKEKLKGYTYGDAIYDANGNITGYKKVAPVYHTGGFVGNITSLKSNEEFAKLLKGEFVSTPAQMDKFIKETLPQIALGGQGGDNIINSPLITIECGQVSKETMPEFKQALSNAVEQIEKKLDSALSRTGHRRGTNKFST